MYQDELWDILDRNRQTTGRLHRRGDTLPEGDFHLTVHIWMRRSDGMFLLTKRSPNKTFPLLWETTAGSAIAGDDSLSAALREVREETGLILKPENGKLMFTVGPPSYLVNRFVNAENQVDFYSDWDDIVNALSADNVYAFDTPDIFAEYIQYSGGLRRPL